MKTIEELNLTMILYSSLDGYPAVAVPIIAIIAVVILVAFELIALVALCFLKSKKRYVINHFS